MGVDTSLKVRLYSKNDSNYNEVEISAQDNSLASLFTDSSIRYTSIYFNKQTELTEEECELFKLNCDEEDEMMMYSNIQNPEQFEKILEKIHRSLYKVKREALLNDLNKIELQDVSEEEKNKRKKLQMADYFDFEKSFGIMFGIIKTAKHIDCRIQIVAEFY